MGPRTACCSGLEIEALDRPAGIMCGYSTGVAGAVSNGSGPTLVPGTGPPAQELRASWLRLVR